MRKEDLDEFGDEQVIVPPDLPDYSMINGGFFYDYYKINRWLDKGLLFRLTFEDVLKIVEMFDDHDSDIAEKLSNQLLHYTNHHGSCQTPIGDKNV